MRDFLNGILSFIGATSLTDAEFATVELTVQSYSVATFEALLSVLDTRELVSNTRDRLKAYYVARGVDVSLSSAGKSNIYVGSVLCD